MYGSFGMLDSPVEAVWVNATEAAEITGYSPLYVTRLARRIYKKPEAEREIQIMKRSNRYDLWLPDLIAYIEGVGHGPQRKRNPSSS